MTDHTYDPRPMPQDQREGNLPIWAQALIRDLRKDCHEAQLVARQALLATDPNNSDAILDPHGEAPIGLGTLPYVRYRLPRGYVNICLRDNGDGSLEITTSDLMAIHPGSSNQITVSVRP